MKQLHEVRRSRSGTTSQAAGWLRLRFHIYFLFYYRAGEVLRTAMP